MRTVTTSAQRIRDAAIQILREGPDPVVRFRLLRDVLRYPPDADALVQARREMLQSRWILELQREQRKDGGWGRFHSAVRIGRGIGTTETAVERGLALGLEASDSILLAASNYVSDLLRGFIDFPDPPERNNRWDTGKRLFAAATLARIHPTLPILDETWELWATIADRTFASGSYDELAEIGAHQALTGASVRNSYLVLNNRYQLALLGSRASRLPEAVERALVDWVWHSKRGIRYLEVPLSSPPRRTTPGILDRLFTSLELLAAFPSWRRFAGGLIAWMWDQRTEDGLWDFGPRPGTSAYFPLSDSYRRLRRRLHDWSTRVLVLLGRQNDASRLNANLNRARRLSRTFDA